MTAITTSGLQDDVDEPSPSPADLLPDYRKATAGEIFGYCCMTFGCFLSILDIQIVASSIAQIQSGLSASVEEISWVQTSYLIAEVIMIPLSPILCRALSTRVLFTTCCIGFTLASLLCAMATSIEQMILFRAIQGFLSGGMVPIVFSAAFLLFGRIGGATAMMLASMSMVIGPVVGPSLGGWISNAFGWQWMFLVNVPLGSILAVAVWLLVDVDKPDHSLFRTMDRLGLVSMAVSLGGMQFVLEEGAKKNWFDEAIIRNWTVVAVLAGIVFIYRSLTHRTPILILKPLVNGNFVAGSLLMMFTASTLYGGSFLMPLYLARIGLMDSMMVGNCIAVSGLAMLLVVPFSTVLARWLDPRVIALLGIGTIALSNWQFSFITHEWRFEEFIWPQVWRGVGLVLCTMSMSNVAFATLSAREVPDASGLFNLTRNLGGAISIAILNTLLVDRGHLHWQDMMSAMGRQAVATQDFIDNLAGQIGSAVATDPSVAAAKAVSLLAEREAFVMAFADCYTLLAWGSAALMVLPLLLRKAEAGTAAPAGAH